MSEHHIPAGRVGLVTGASSGVGRAISAALAHQCEEMYLVGRDPVRLAETAAITRDFSQVRNCPVDLTDEESIRALQCQIEGESGRLDVLVHSAGIFSQSRLDEARIEDFDRQYAINVRVPYMLTQRLLPLLEAARGQVVFLNSSAGLTAKRAEIGQYAATKHALRAIADSLREEVNSRGIRVLTIYLGRTATPMQEAICQREGKVYHPEQLLQPSDIATVVAQSLMLPSTAEITDINIRPMRKP
jgi:NADP-dependent 3-hydroxy acid dehydrogenase YdfG